MIPLTVAIVTRNRPSQVVETLAAVCAQPSIQDEVLVVDDGSDDEARTDVLHWIGEHAPRVRFISMPFRGLSEARNAAVANARCEVICFIDDDATPCAGWLDALRSAWQAAGPDIAVVGGPIRPGWTTRPEWLVDELLYVVSILDHGPPARRLDSGNHCWGANMSLRRSAVRGVGGFDPSWGAAPGRIGGRADEDELQLRLATNGYGVLWLPEAAVVHRVTQERLTVDSFRQFMREQSIRTRDQGTLSRGEALYRTFRTGVRYALANMRGDAVDATVASIFLAGYSAAAFSRRLSERRA